MLIKFDMPASKYFEVDPASLKEAGETNTVMVEMDTQKKTSYYTWFPIGENPANFIPVRDDFEGVASLLGKANDFTIYREYSETELDGDKDWFDLIVAELEEILGYQYELYKYFIVYITIEKLNINKRDIEYWGDFTDFNGNIVYSFYAMYDKVENITNMYVRKY